MRITKRQLKTIISNVIQETREWKNPYSGRDWRAEEAALKSDKYFLIVKEKSFKKNKNAWTSQGGQEHHVGSYWHEEEAIAMGEKHLGTMGFFEEYVSYRIEVDQVKTPANGIPAMNIHRPQQR